MFVKMMFPLLLIQCPMTMIQPIRLVRKTINQIGHHISIKSLASAGVVGGRDCPISGGDGRGHGIYMINIISCILYPRNTVIYQS